MPPAASDGPLSVNCSCFRCPNYDIGTSHQQGTLTLEFAFPGAPLFRGGWGTIRLRPPGHSATGTQVRTGAGEQRVDPRREKRRGLANDAIHNKNSVLTLHVCSLEWRTDTTDAIGEPLLQRLPCYKKIVPMASCLGFGFVQYSLRFMLLLFYGCFSEYSFGSSFRECRRMVGTKCWIKQCVLCETP